MKEEPLEAVIRNRLTALRHRGPDASTVTTFTGGGAQCVMGHLRLRIIDLSASADQPMPNERRTVWVAYNGEIYNFKELRAELQAKGHLFQSQTDTDVLAHLYEESRNPEEMLSRLRGMFAFALFDREQGSLLLGRDRLGIKPMYWAETSDGIAFGSEARAIAKTYDLTEPDAEALTSYLLWGVVQGPRTIFSGVHELPPGSYLQWKQGNAKVERWWRPVINPNLESGQDARRLMRDALDDSIARHLVADRPIGVFLSSGVDSAAVATASARHSAVKALTVTFPDAADEGDEAQKVAKRIGADHMRVQVTGEDVARDLPSMLSAMDQPTSDGINTWIVCRATKEAGLVVALSGLGGDELFGGYPSSHLVPRLAQLNGLLRPVPSAIRRTVAGLAARRDPGSRLARALASGPGYEGAYMAVRGLLPTGTFRGSVRPEDRNGFSKHHPEDAVMLLEMAHYLPNQLLRDTDQMSMSHSLEIRVPLLDDEMVNLAFRIPAGVRTESGKALLARAAGLVELNRKQPFALPFAAWFRGPLRPTVREALLSEELPFADLVPAELRRNVWDAFESGRAHWSRAWAIAVLRLWPSANGLRWR
jgi:asparagine synthase (glutamine-hydrolysing)